MEDNNVELSGLSFLIILTYLKEIHINKLEIHGICNNRAINFYEKTGAKIINSTVAEYDVEQALELIKPKEDNNRNIEKKD